MKITVSAPGKIHLMGEHAVVYGKPAVLAAVSQRLYVEVSSLQFAVSSKKKEKNLSVLREKDSYLNEICTIVEKKFQIQLPSLSFSVSSTIPIGCGMGSSAAFALALIGALLTVLEKPWNIQTINELAFDAEKFQHGTPSGGDNSVICFGGMLWFRREFEFLKTFWALPIKIPTSFAPFILVNTGKPKESTKKLVQNVELRIKNKELETKHIFNEIEIETKRMVQGVHDENEKEVRNAIANGEQLLEKLGVVSKSTQAFIRDVEKLGGVAKISGAGGIKEGSGIVMVMHKEIAQINDLAKQYGFETFQTRLGQMGIRLEEAQI